MTDSKVSINGFFAVCVLFALFIIVGTMDFEDQLLAQQDYCDRVAAQIHGNFKDINCPTVPLAEEAQQ